MLEFDKELLEDIEDKLRITKKNAIRYKNIYLKFNSDTEKYLKKYDRLNSCLNYWEWDKYKENKLLDLVRVNRCKDRFCPNCRRISLSQALVKFAPLNKEMLKRGYSPYMITLTVPNVPGTELKETIERMNKAFSKFNSWLFYNNHKAFKERFFRAAAIVKVLEVTVQKDNWNMYHPHFHCIAYLDEIKSEEIFIKNLSGVYRKKSNDYIRYSAADIQIMKLWKFAYENIRITNYDKYPDTFEYDEKNKQYYYYQCDIRELELPLGIYEVFKYTFKDTDIHTQQNFETLYFALNGKRLRQGYGELYNLELDCEGEIDKDKENIKNYLEKGESPERIYIQEINKLIKDYHEYKKISRFKALQYIQNLE